MANGRNSTRRGLHWLGAILWLFSLPGVECCAQEQLIPFEEGGLWGYKDFAGQVVIQPQFHVAEKFSREGLAAVADDQSWAYIDTKGNIVIRPFVFDNGPDEFSEGLARFIAGSKFGFFNKQGRVVIMPQFDFAARFSQSLAAVCMGCRQHRMGEHSMTVGGKWGYISNQGHIVIPLQFDAAGDFEKGKAHVSLNGKRMLIDRKGHVTGDSP